MAFLQANLDAIDSAISSGELSVSFDGKTIVYRSMADLLRARQFISEQIAAQSSVSNRQSFVQFNRGT